MGQGPDLRIWPLDWTATRPNLTRLLRPRHGSRQAARHVLVPRSSALGLGALAAARLALLLVSR